MPRKAISVPELIVRNGVFYVTWYAPLKKRMLRLSLGTTDPVEARTRFGAFLLEERDTGGNAVLTVSAALAQYEKEHVVACAAPKRQSAAIRMLAAYFGDTPLAAVDIPACRAYAAARAEGVVRPKNWKSKHPLTGKPSTIARELAALKAATNHAKRWKRLAPHHAPTFETPAVPPPDRYKPVLSKADVALAIQEAEGPLRDFIILAYAWGSRREAVESLTSAQVDLAKGFVNLSKPGERLTKKRRPIVPILPETRAVLERLVAANPVGRLFPPRFLAGPGFKKVAQALSLPADYPHALRHARVTHMFEDGENPYKIAALTGDSLKTLLDNYAHLTPEFLGANPGAFRAVGV